MTHTPGPWFVGEPDDNGQAIVRQEHIEIATCWHHCVGSIEQEMHANARLIAAAPEMLEALRFYGEMSCEGIENGCGKCSDDVCAGCKAYALIAKAEGKQ